MSVWEKAKAAVAAFRHGGGGASWTGGGGLLSRTRFDYRREVGDFLDASVVMAPVAWLQRALPEAQLVIRKRAKAGEEPVPVDAHPMLDLIQRPNEAYGDIALWWATVLSLCTDGNAYWMLSRNLAGRPAEMWYVPHWQLEPKWPADGSVFISHYRYTPGGAAPIDVDPDDVIHFRMGINPRNTRKGISPIDSTIREIFMDLESSNFVSSLLKNMGVPGVVISPKNGATPAPDDVAATKAWFQEQFGGDNRGRPLVMGAPTEVSPYGFNPQQMNMGEARDIAEERVCAGLGVPAAIVGFGAGLQSTKVGATMEELRKLAWHTGVLPIARAIADELQRALLWQFGSDAGLTVGWDTSNVPALQEDEDAKSTRWNERLKSGGITVFEWRQALGIDADDSHRFYLRPIGAMEVPEGAIMTAPAILPPPAKGAKHGADDGHTHARVTGRATEAGYKRGLAFVRQVQRQETVLVAGFEKKLAKRFAAWGREARAVALPLLKDATPKGRDGEAKADEGLIAAILEKLGRAAWLAELTQDYGAHFLTVAEAMQDAAERIGLGTSLPDPVGRAIVASGGRRVGLLDVDAQARTAIFEALAEGRAQGDGVQALADRIGHLVEGGPWNEAEYRARLIARTETKYAQNLSTVERAKMAGVNRFVVFDGRLGEGRSDPDHIARDGSIVTAAEADAMAAAEHPNGTLSFAPYFEE